MSYYDEAVSGIQQLMDAFFNQQTKQAAPVEVDEMQMNQSQIADAFAGVDAQGTNFTTGVDAMQAAMRAAGQKEKDIPKPYGGGTPRGF